MLNAIQGSWGAEASHWARGGVHPGHLPITGPHREKQLHNTLTPRVNFRLKKEINCH